MFLLTYLREPINITKPNNYSIDLAPGYYNVTLRGAQGGQACKNGMVAETSGGLGAKLTGILHLTGIFTYTITVGSKPETNCLEHINYGGLYGLGGNSGRDPDREGEQGGGGGGHSSIYLCDHDLILGMVGGGSGASHSTDGGSAGGINYSYGCNPENDTKIMCEDCWSLNFHQGGNGKDYEFIPGSGGGGGFFGGRGGDKSMVMASRTCGFGGSSHFSENHWIKLMLKDGTQHSETGNGFVLIEPVRLCSEGCNDCEIDNGNKCTSCLNGYFMYGSLCYESCVVTPEPTYLSGFECVRCPPTCSSCTDGKTCQFCLPGYSLYNGKCESHPIPQNTSKSSHYDHCKKEACNFLAQRRFIRKIR